jgi:hypothetical protein
MPIFKGRPRPSSRMKTDGLIVAYRHVPAPKWLLCAVIELKLGLGSKGDSSFEGAAYYGVFWEARRTSAFYHRTCCPALLLEVVGPLLRVSALYWLSNVTLRPLTPLMNLLWFSDDPDHMIALARTLAAIRATLAQLRDFYLAPPSALGPGGPAPRPPHLLEAMPYPLADYHRVKRLFTGRLVYTAVLPSDGQRVLVRFAKRYGEQAHRAWASHGLAPKLHRVVELPGNWLLVEMELLGSDEGWVEMACWPGPDASTVVDAVQAALQQAHQAQDGTVGRVFAHGDMRVQNIMVREAAPGSGSAYDVKFVDFEFAGAEGEASYPPYLSKAVVWPPGVAFGEPVRQQHDSELLATNCAQLLQAIARGRSTAGPDPPAAAAGGTPVAAVAPPPALSPRGSNVHGSRGRSNVCGSSGLGRSAHVWQLPRFAHIPRLHAPSLPLPALRRVLV